MTHMTAPAYAVRPGDLITSHPDHPDQRIRYRVVRGAYGVSGGGVGIEYTAPADEVPGLIPADRACGVLVLAPDAVCQIDRADPWALPIENAARQAVDAKEAAQS